MLGSQELLLIVPVLLVGLVVLGLLGLLGYAIYRSLNSSKKPRE